MIHRRIRPGYLVRLLMVFGFVLASAGIGLAQEATPTGSAPAHPAHVHEGTCDNLNPAPLFPLNDVTAAQANRGTSAGGTAAIETSVTAIATSLSDIADGNRAINVHESAENIETYIACGEIAGAPIATSDGGSELPIALRELNGSGYAGIALLRDLDDQTEVRVYLFQGLTGGSASTPASDSGEQGAHGDHGDMAAAVQVDIQNFAYAPDPVTIPVGGSVTWTNRDSAPHTVTGQDRDVLQSGTLNQGESFTQTFDTPGTYTYFCEFHPNMQGTLIVE